MNPSVIRILRSLWLAILLFVIVPAQAATRTILIVGDSLSSGYGIDVRQGWVMLLQQRLEQQQRDYKVVNASISGDTTANGLARLPSLLIKHTPNVVVIALGGNDGLRGLSTEEMQRNLTSMVAQAKTRGAKIILAGVRIPPNYGPRYTEMFRHVYQNVATGQKIPLVPLILAGIDLDATLMQADRVHPTAAAQGKILENVWEELERLL